MEMYVYIARMGLYGDVCIYSKDGGYMEVYVHITRMGVIWRCMNI